MALDLSRLREIDLDELRNLDFNNIVLRIKAQKPLPDSQKALKLLLSDPISGAGMSSARSSSFRPCFFNALT